MTIISQGSASSAASQVQTASKAQIGNSQTAQGSKLTTDLFRGQTDALQNLINQLLRLFKPGKPATGGSGSGQGTGSNANKAAQRELQTNQQKWQKAGIDDYSFTLQRNCFCRGDATRPVNIEVQDGKIASATFADTGEPLPADTDFNKLTVNDLFKQVGEVLSSGAERVDVKYDPKYGFPTSIYIDRSSQIADEEVGFTISNFQRNDKPTFTTLAVGEEDGGGGGCPLPKPEPPIATTLALGEEDGGGGGRPLPKPEPPTVTTMAYGEEDNGGGIGTLPKPRPEPPTVTTLALGEEDGGVYRE